ncbi:hypothetical protein J8273_4606, partial [Carpediemonas membranifera]
MKKDDDDDDPKGTYPKYLRHTAADWVRFRMSYALYAEDEVKPKTLFECIDAKVRTSIKDAYQALED